MDRQYVGIDFHRRRSVIVRKNSAGEKLSSARVPNDPLAIAAVVADAGPEPEVVIEATYGWYWIVDWLQEQGATVHLANPSGLNWGTRRVKNDERDAIDLVDMLRLGRLPEAWIAPPTTRELRELVRYRAKLVALRSGLKAQVHAVMAKEGVLPAVTDMFCKAGNAQLDDLQLGDAYAIRVESLRDLIEVYDREVAMLERNIHQRLRGDTGYRAIQAIKRDRPDHGRDPGGRDRRRHPLPIGGRVVFVGRTHAQTQRVRHHRAPRATHQARIAARAVGGRRRHRPVSRRRQTRGRLPQDRRAARQEQSDRRDRPQSPHARLLRPTRRHDPLPGQRRVTKLGHDPTRARNRHDPRTTRRGRRTA
jgi:Transposase